MLTSLERSLLICFTSPKSKHPRNAKSSRSFSKSKKQILWNLARDGDEVNIPPRQVVPYKLAAVEIGLERNEWSIEAERNSIVLVLLPIHAGACNPRVEIQS